MVQSHSRKHQAYLSPVIIHTKCPLKSYLQVLGRIPKVREIWGKKIEGIFFLHLLASSCSSDINILLPEPGLFQLSRGNMVLSTGSLKSSGKVNPIRGNHTVTCSLNMCLLLTSYVSAIEEGRNDGVAFSAVKKIGLGEEVS